MTIRVNQAVQDWFGLNWNEDDLKYKLALMENVKSTADFGQAKPGRYGVPQYFAKDRPVVNPANMPGRTLTQGQPQQTSLMNIGSTLPPLHLIQRRRFG